MTKIITLADAETPRFFARSMFVALEGGRQAVYPLVLAFWLAILVGLRGAIFLAALKIVLRSRVAAAVVVAVGFSFLRVGTLLSDALFYVTSTALLLRYGMLAYVCTVFSWNLLASYPATTDLGRWYSGYGVFVVVALLTIGVYGFVLIARSHNGREGQRATGQSR